MIQKVYEIDPLLCPFCGGEVKILSFIIKPKTIKKILDAMDLLLFITLIRNPPR